MGCFALNLAQALEDEYAREIPREGASKLPSVNCLSEYKPESLFSWFQILGGVTLDVPLARRAEGQKTEFAGIWAICLSDQSPTLEFTYAW